MIRYLGGSDPLDLLIGIRHGPSAKSMWGPRANEPEPAIRSKSEVSEQLSSGLQTSLTSLAAAVEQWRRNLSTTEPEVKVEHRFREEDTPGTFTRLESAREINPTASEGVRSSRGPMGQDLFEAPTRLVGLEEINTTQMVDLDAPFDGALDAQRPQLENGRRVTAGEFSVNGVRVSVRADDSIRQVLERIGTQVAGLEATVSNNTAVLSTTGPSTQPIVVGGDTSGFLAAMKWEGATASLGRIADVQKPLSETAVFAGLVRGSFWLNGVQVSVEPQTDSVYDLVNRINQSGADVEASYDRTSDRFSLTPRGPVLDLAQDTSGFLAAAGLAEGMVASKVNPDGAFQYSGFAGPRFEPGVSVQSGTFEINGHRIDVASSDSISSVLSKINQSAADVQAEYHDDTETVSLLRKTAGALPITLGSDTSGFFRAVKWDETAALSLGEAPVSRRQVVLSRDDSNVRVELLDKKHAAVQLVSEVQRVSDSLQKIASDSTVDSELKSAVRAALSQLVLPSGVAALEDNISVSAESLEKGLSENPTAVLDGLSAKGGLVDALQNALAVERHARAQKENRIEISESDMRTLRLMPGVLDQAEILIQGRLLTLLLSLPRMEAAQAATPDFTRAIAAYGQVMRSEHDPPAYTTVEKRATSPPVVGTGKAADSFL